MRMLKIFSGILQKVKNYFLPIAISFCLNPFEIPKSIKLKPPNAYMHEQRILYALPVLK
jgi:hypothetical protein